jgi:hypothetical protein
MDRDDNQRPPSGGSGPVRAAAGEPAGLLQPWRRIGGLLAALIGESGFCVLFGRALRTVAARHAWLGPHGERNSIAALLRAYETDLAGADPAQAAAANAALLDTFTRQLSALIGDTLTARLLADAKQETDGREGPQDGQEHSND